MKGGTYSLGRWYSAPVSWNDRFSMKVAIGKKKRYISCIHPELRIENYPFDSGKGSGPLEKEQRSIGKHGRAQRKYINEAGFSEGPKRRHLIISERSRLSLDLGNTARRLHCTMSDLLICKVSITSSSRQSQCRQPEPLNLPDVSLCNVIREVEHLCFHEHLCHLLEKGRLHLLGHSSIDSIRIWVSPSLSLSPIRGESPPRSCSLGKISDCLALCNHPSCCLRAADRSHDLLERRS